MILAVYHVGIIGIDAWSDAGVVIFYFSRPLDKDELKQRCGADITLYRDVKKLIADDNVNVVDICCYHRQHVRQVIVAM
ncbi:MAG: hypothetical protein MK102_09655 [Fuerstiella sp.]|nr:hypothetical protein [Fuerstiella sp.]